MSITELQDLFDAAWRADPHCQGSPGWRAFADALEAFALTDALTARHSGWVAEALRGGAAYARRCKPSRTPGVARTVAELLLFNREAILAGPQPARVAADEPVVVRGAV